jgi:hypothetical protein
MKKKKKLLHSMRMKFQEHTSEGEKVFMLYKGSTRNIHSMSSYHDAGMYITSSFPLIVCAEDENLFHFIVCVSASASAAAEYDENVVFLPQSKNKSFSHSRTQATAITTIRERRKMVLMLKLRIFFNFFVC